MTNVTKTIEETKKSGLFSFFFALLLPVFLYSIYLLYSNLPYTLVCYGLNKGLFDAKDFTQIPKVGMFWRDFERYLKTFFFSKIAMKAHIGGHFWF